MIELTFYEKRKVRLQPAQILDLDEKVRGSLGVGFDECLLVHDLLIHGRKYGLGVRIPRPEDLEPDDDSGPPSKSHLGYTRSELIAWVEQKQAEYMEGVPDIFEGLDDERRECKVCQTALEDGECPNRKCGNSPLYSQQ